MGEHFIHLYFYSDKQIEKKLVSKVISTFLDRGLEYKDKYWVRGNNESTMNKSLNDAIEEVAIHEGSIDFNYNRLTLEKEVKVGFYKDGINDRLIKITITIWEFLFDKENVGEENCSINAGVLLELMKSLYYTLQPIYGYCDRDICFSWIYDYLEDPETPKQLETLNLHRIYWVNFFSPELVQKIGREKLLSSPSWKTEELKDGGILLILGVTPYELEVEREEVEKHLGFK